MTVVVLGFGAFLEVTDNPASHLATAVHGLGRRITIVGAEMPASYARGHAVAAEAMARHNPVLLLGVGVARGRTLAMVERTAFAEVSVADPDVDGDFGEIAGATAGATAGALTGALTGATAGPISLESPVATALAAALELPVSDDAGRYVCNAWLYRALRGGFPAAFLHVPPQGWPVEALIDGLERWATIRERRAFLAGA